MDAEAEKMRAFYHEQVDRAFDSGDLHGRIRAGTRQLPPAPGDRFVRRDFTGKHALLLTWEEPRG